MPDLLRDNLVNFLWIAIMVTVAIVAVPILRHRLRQSEEDHSDLLLVVERGRKAFIAVVVIAAVRIALLGADYGDSPLVGLGERITAIAFIVALMWLLIEILLAVEAVVLARYAPLRELSKVDVRQRRTQVILIRRLVVAVVITIAVGAVLMTFPAIRVF